MGSFAEYLTPAEAARRLGVSAKALRLYEARGLIAPGRNAAGWRVYGPDDLARAGDVIALRGLGLSLQQIGQVLAGSPDAWDAALARHQTALDGQLRGLAARLAKVRTMRAALAGGQMPGAAALLELQAVESPMKVAFALPWPWGGEEFALSDVSPLTWITGPLFSGKTKLARRIAEALPGAAFLGLERREDGHAAARAKLAADPELGDRVGDALGWLVDDGATDSPALAALVAELAAARGPLVVDMIEEGLDEATQLALAAWLRRGRSEGQPLFLLTRSNAMLDMEAVGPEETILYCPANHSPPLRVLPHPGATGYEAVATCLAPPEVRARAAGVVAIRRDVA